MSLRILQVIFEFKFHKNFTRQFFLIFFLKISSLKFDLYTATLRDPINEIKSLIIRIVYGKTCFVAGEILDCPVDISVKNAFAKNIIEKKTLLYVKCFSLTVAPLKENVYLLRWRVPITRNQVSCLIKSEASVELLWSQNDENEACQKGRENICCTIERESMKTSF